MAIKIGTNDVVDKFVGSQLVERAYKGTDLIFDAYSDVAGTLPLSFTARAQQALRNYRLYGTSEGAGKNTANLFNKDAKDTNNGYVKNHYLLINGDTAENSGWDISEYIPVDIGTTYYLYWYVNSSSLVSFCLYNENKQRIVGYKYGSNRGKTFIPETAKYVRFSVRNSGEIYPYVGLYENPMTTPEPYGYKIPLTLTSGQNTDTYPLYIGSTKLGEEEYVDYAEQKVYKRNLKSFIWMAKFAKNSNRVDYFAYWTAEDRTYMQDGCGFLIKRGVEEILTINTDGVYNQSILADLNTSLYKQVTFKDLGQGCNFRTYVIINNEYIYGDNIHITYDDVIASPDEAIYFDRPPIVLPTDPPSPLPAITAYQGENTLSSTETVGEVTVTGRISEVPETSEP